MSTDIRADLSVKNKYWISKHRYYELKHFCLQYPEWKKTRSALDGYSGIHYGNYISTSGTSDPTATKAIMRSELSQKIELVEKIAKDAGDDIAEWILLGVTNGWSYIYMHMNFNIPCSKDMYYDRYRKFFWLLSRN